MHFVEIATVLAAGVGAAGFAALLRRPIHQLSVASGSTPRDRCDRCPRPSSPTAIVTYRVRLGARCPTCGSRLPSGVVPTELVAAIIGILTALRYGPSLALLAAIWLAAAGTALAVIDIRVHRLPNYLVFPGYVVGLVCFTAAAIVDGTPRNILRALLAMALVYIVFFVLNMISPRGLGFGDVKLGGVLGLYLGYLGWSTVLIGILLAILANGLVAAVMLATRRIKRDAEIPFGPFLLGGALVAAIGGLGLIRAAIAAIVG